MQGEREDSGRACQCTSVSKWSAWEAGNGKAGTGLDAMRESSRYDDLRRARLVVPFMLGKHQLLLVRNEHACMKTRHDAEQMAQRFVRLGLSALLWCKQFVCYRNRWLESDNRGVFTIHYTLPRSSHLPHAQKSAPPPRSQLPASTG